MSRGVKRVGGWLAYWNIVDRKNKEKQKLAERLKMKNPCGKMRKIENPYEIWVSEFHPLFEGRTEFRVLKKYQTPEQEAKNPYARWMCAVQSPCTFGGWDMGDTYISDIVCSGAHRVYNEAVDGPKTFPKNEE